MAINMILLWLSFLENIGQPRIEFLKKYWLDLLIGLTIGWFVGDRASSGPLSASAMLG